MNASVAIQVLPTVTDDEEVIRIVDAVIDYIKSTGLSYYVGPCETSIEGDYDELMEIVKNCQLVAAKAGCTPKAISKTSIRNRLHILLLINDLFPFRCFIILPHFL